MIIALTGAHSTGKTTLLEELKKNSNFKGYNFITELTRNIAKQGYKINEEGSNLTQISIMELHLCNLTYKNSIMDRCFLDGIVYTDYLYQKNRVSLDIFNKCLLLFQQNIKKYDRLFYIVPEVSLVEDGVRSPSLMFRQDIIKLFEFYIDFYRLPVINIFGNLEERVNQIIFNLGESDEV